LTVAWAVPQQYHWAKCRRVSHRPRCLPVGTYYLPLNSATNWFLRLLYVHFPLSELYLVRGLACAILSVVELVSPYTKTGKKTGILVGG